MIVRRGRTGVLSETSPNLRILRPEGIDMRFFRRRKYSRVGEAIVEIAERYRERLGTQVTDDIEVDCRHGEEEIAFELLIEMLYEEEIESPPDERRVLRELGEQMEIPEENMFFWPEPIKRSAQES